MLATAFFTGGIVRRYAHKAFISASVRTVSGGMSGLRALPSGRLPNRTASANWASVHFPMPVSGSGVQETGFRDRLSALRGLNLRCVGTQKRDDSGYIFIGQ